MRLTDKQYADGTAEECVLRFFAFSDRYKEFDHSVVDFLNNYMKDSSKDFDFESREREFRAVFSQLAEAFPDGIMRPERKGRTPLNLFEGVVVGAAFAIRKEGKLVTDDISKWMRSKELRSYTTAGTNNLKSVKGRIEFCRDRFLGIRYEPDSD